MLYRWLRVLTQRLTLSAHLFLCLGLTAAVPILLLGGVQTRWWAAIQVDQADYQSRLVAQVVAREVGLLVDTDAKAVEGLARLIEAQGMHDPSALQRMTVRQRQAFDTFSLMYIGDAAGKALAGDPSVDAQGVPTAGKVFSDRDYYLKLMATDQTAISRVQIGRTVGVPTIQIASPVHDPDGNIIGFAEGSLDLGVIQQLVEVISGKDVLPYATVVDAEGQVIAYAGNGGGAVMRNLSDRPLYRPTIEANGEARQGEDEQGENVRAIITPITVRDLGWTVVVTRPDAVDAAQITVSDRRAMTAAAGALLAALALAAILSRLLAHPTAQLAGVTAAVGRGDLTQPPMRPKIWHPREIQSLFATVNHMIAQMRSRTEDLEHRVAERTTALQATNVELDASLARLQRARDEAEEAQQQYASLFEQNPDSVLSLDSQLHLVSTNPACERLFGYGADELIGGSLKPLIATEDREIITEQLRLVGQGKPRDFEISVIRRDGLHVAVAVTALPMVIKGSIAGVYCIAKDVTERRRTAAALEHQALHDALTGLPNRTLLNDRLERVIIAHQRSERGLALLVMDLDHFKDVNDTLGHQTGDELLRQVAARLQTTLRTSDTIARLGGDEFAILLPSVRVQGGVGVAQKVLKALEQPFTVDGQELTIAASLGIAACPDHGVDPETLLRRADVAMYVAKRNKGGYVVYEAEQDQNNVDRLALAGDLRRGIENEELRLHYQPKVSFRTGRLIRVEALVRWEHPEQGLVQPDKFIPLSEQTGLIRPLSQWVLNEALKQYHAWRKTGLLVPIAVNLSMHNLQDPELPARWAGCSHGGGSPHQS